MEWDYVIRSLALRLSLLVVCCDSLKKDSRVLDGLSGRDFVIGFQDEISPLRLPPTPSASGPQISFMAVKNTGGSLQA